MVTKNTQKYGKRKELDIISKMLEENLDVYVPIVDDHGIDCIITRDELHYCKVQIKSRSSDVRQPGCFTVDNHEVVIPNFYFVFFCEKTDCFWIFSSEEFCDCAKLRTNCKTAGRRKITLVSAGGRKSKKYLNYCYQNFDRIQYK